MACTRRCCLVGRGTACGFLSIEFMLAFTTARRSDGRWKTDMAHQPATNSQYMRLGLWTLASIAAVASAAAIYFASRSHHEHLRGAVFATQLSMKEQELFENQRELARSKSELARAAKKANRPANAPIVAPAASSSPDSQGQPELEAFKEMIHQQFLATWHSIYDPMLTHFKLSQEQRKRFYELHSQGMTPDSEKELREMFGEKGFQAYVSYADTEHERSMLLQFQQQTDKSLQISDRQYDRLGETLYYARKQYPQNPGGIADSYDAALVQAAQFLTPEQLEAARSFYHNQAEALRFGQTSIPPGSEKMTPPDK